jgi:hypothetical protein
MKKSMQFLSVLLAFFMFASAATAADAIFPKTIAPDLVIESVEQGAFLDDPADPRHFRLTNVVPHRNRYLFGWRMKVTTTRKSILVQELDPNGKGRNGMPVRSVPKAGYIFRATDLVSSLQPGRREYKISVENQPVKYFSYVIK